MPAKMPTSSPSIAAPTRPLTRPLTKTSTPIKPILKTTLLGKRKHSDNVSIPSDGVTEGLQSPQRKRQKVEFNMNLEIHEVLLARSVDEIKQEIRKTLVAHARGDEEEYDILKETLSGKQRFSDDDEDEDDPDPSLPEKRRQELKVYMVALASFTPQLGRSSNGLIKSVLQCQWLGRDEQFAKIYTQFLAALVSAQGSYLTQVLSMMIDKFADSRPSAWAVPGYPDVSRECAQERLHVALQYLLGLFPAASAIVGQLITTKFPYYDEPKREYLAYVNNLLRLRQYATQIRTDIMDLIINRLVQIDVQMQMDLDDLDDDQAFLVAKELERSKTNADSQDEDFEDDSDNESIDSEEDDEDEQAVRVKAVTESVEKMDSIMDSLFELYTPRFANPDSDEATSAFEDLLAEFSHIILPTYKSRHTQFLIFHFGQRSEALMDAYCGTCVKVAFESQRPLVLRQAASAYLASFVARGAHVPGHIVRTIFEVLGYHLDEMRTSYEPGCRGPDVRRYAPFYALTQALMYIFCFRWRDLIRSVPEDVDQDDPTSFLGHEIEWETDIKDILRRNIDSKLNPLKVCSPAIVEQFANLALHFRFMYLHTKIEANKRIRLSQFVSSAYANGGALRESGLDLSDESSQQLDSYFPFDPYQLPVSKRWVESDYLKWQPVLSHDDEDDSDEGEPEDEDDNIEEDTATDDEAAGDN